MPEVTFTGEPLYVRDAEYPDRRKFIDEFYKSFDIAASAPWNMSSVPLPPKDSVQSNLDYNDQLFVFAKYLINEIAPIILNELYRKEGYDPVSGVDYNYNGKARFLSTLIPNNLEECRAISEIIGCYYKESMRDKKVESVGSHALVMLRNACDGTFHGVIYAAYPILFASMSDPEATWKSTIEMLERISPFYDSQNWGMSGARNNPTSHTKHRAKTGGTMRRKSPRDNATFTGKPLHDASNSLVDAFYAKIDELIPGSTPVPIPPPESVHPKHDSQQQAFIFADYAVRKFAPTALDAADLQEGADKLRKLRKIVDLETATIAVSAARRVYYPINPSGFHTSALSHAISAVSLVIVDLEDLTDHGNEIAASSAAAAAEAANFFAFYAANLNPEAIWKAVNEMLAELSGVRSNKSTLKSKAKPPRDNSRSMDSNLELAREIGNAAPYLLEDKDSVAGVLDRRRMNNHIEAEYFKRVGRMPTKEELDLAFDVAQDRSYNLSYRMRQRDNPVEFSILRKDTKEAESFHNIDANIRRHFPDDWVDPNDLSEMERDLGAEWYYGWYEWIQVGHTFKDIVAKIKKAAGMERNNYSEGPKKGSREEYYERLVAIYNWLDRKYTLRTKHVSLR